MTMNSRTHSWPGSIVQAPNACSAMLGDDLYVFDLEDRRLHVMNTSAAAVWRAACEGTDATSLVDQVAATYGLVGDVIREDVVSIVAHLLENGLLVDTAASPRPVGVEPTEVRPRAEPGRSRILLGPFVGLGVQINIHCSNAEVAALLDSVLDPLRDGRRATPGVVELAIELENDTWTVWSDGTLLLRTAVREMAVRTLLSECNAAPLRHLDDHVVFHASAADCGSGLVMFAGVSNAGKSTLVTQLVERGHGYVSDEAIAVSTQSGRVLPFHKSICLESGAQQLFGHLHPDPDAGRLSVWDIDPRKVGPGVLSPGGTLAAIVFPTFESTATTCELTPVSRHDAVRLLLANAFEFDRVGQAAFERIVSLAADVPAYTLVHGGGDAPLRAVEALAANVSISL